MESNECGKKHVIVTMMVIQPLHFNVAQYLVFCLVYCGPLFVLLFNLRIMDFYVLFGVMKLFVVVVELKARCQIL
jgi:hypothetical protein